MRLKPGVVVNACNLSTQEPRQEDLELKVSLGYLVRGLTTPSVPVEYSRGRVLTQHVQSPGLQPQHCRNWAQQGTPGIPALRKSKGRRIRKFKGILSNIVSRG